MRRKPLVLRVPKSAAYAIGYLAEAWLTLTQTGASFPAKKSRKPSAPAGCAIRDVLPPSLGFDASIVSMPASRRHWRGTKRPAG